MLKFIGALVEAVMSLFGIGAGCASVVGGCLYVLIMLVLIGAICGVFAFIAEIALMVV